jgi:hypothetical protein
MPAMCFFRLSRSQAGLKDLDVIFSVFLLGYNILLRMLKLHRTVSETLSPKIRQVFVCLARPTLRAILSLLTSAIFDPRLTLVLYMLFLQPFVACLILAKAYYLMYTSMVSEVRVDPYRLDIQSHYYYNG